MNRIVERIIFLAAGAVTPAIVYSQHLGGIAMLAALAFVLTVARAQLVQREPEPAYPEIICDGDEPRAVRRPYTGQTIRLSEGDQQ